MVKLNEFETSHVDSARRFIKETKTFVTSNVKTTRVWKDVCSKTADNRTCSSAYKETNF